MKRTAPVKPAAPRAKYVLRSAVKQLIQLEQSLQLAGIHTSVLNPLRDALTSKLEALPISMAGTANKPIMFFVLSGGEWFPCHGGFEIEEGVRKGWLNFRTDYDNGSADSGPAQPYEWAHCTADNLPNYHWLETVEPPPVSKETTMSATTISPKEQMILALADKIDKAAYGNEDAAITQDDLDILGIKLQKTFKSKHYGRINVEGGWEAFCIFIYEKVTKGEKHPGSVARGRGFRSQAFGRELAEAIRLRAAILSEPLDA